MRERTYTQLFHSQLEREVESFGQIKSFPAGTQILEEEGSIKSIPIVLEGILRVIRKDEAGKEILLYYIRPGESCIMSFLGGIHHEPSGVSAVVEEDARLLLIPVDKAGEWVKQYPEWTDFIFRLYHKRFEELLRVVNSIAFTDLGMRLKQVLEQKSALQKSRDLQVTHQQLADDLGSSREVISRLLKQMENRGELTLYRNKIHLM